MGIVQCKIDDKNLAIEGKDFSSNSMAHLTFALDAGSGESHKTSVNEDGTFSFKYSPKTHLSKSGNCIMVIITDEKGESENWSLEYESLKKNSRVNATLQKPSANGSIGCGPDGCPTA